MKRDYPLSIAARSGCCSRWPVAAAVVRWSITEFSCLAYPPVLTLTYVWLVCNYLHVACINIGSD